MKLPQPTVWLTVARAANEGHACRDYVIYDVAGGPLLEARAHPWRRDIVVRTVAEPREPVVVLRRRRSFPITGRVDVYDERRARIGVVGRSGVYRDRERRVIGRFRDARTAGERTREGIVIGVMDALLGGDGTVADVSGPGGYVWLLGSTPIGTLARAPLPFAAPGEQDEGADEPRATRGFARLTQRVRAFAKPRTPRGWKLENRVDAALGDERVVIAAALFAIELSHW